MGHDEQLRSVTRPDDQTRQGRKEAGMQTGFRLVEHHQGEKQRVARLVLCLGDLVSRYQMLLSNALKRGELRTPR